MLAILGQGAVPPAASAATAALLGQEFWPALETTVASSCSPDGKTLTYEITGETFTGPAYNGTLVESGSVTFGGPANAEGLPYPFDVSASQVTAVSSRWTVTAGSTTITGTRSLAPYSALAAAQGWVGVGTCAELVNTNLLNSNCTDLGCNYRGTTRQFGAWTDWQATISGPDGEYNEFGSGGVSFYDTTGIYDYNNPDQEPYIFRNIPIPAGYRGLQARLATATRGTVPEPFLVTSAGSNLGDIALGDSRYGTFYLANYGTADLTFASITATGPAAAEIEVLEVPGGTCLGEPIPPTSYCLVRFRLTPVTPGPKSATLEYASNAPGSPHSALVTANGVGGLPPPAPTSVTAAAGDGQASVSWAAPASDGGSPITSYTVTSSRGDLTATTAGPTSATVTGLSNGTPYTFTVSATNAIGTGASSAASSAVTPQAGAAAPQTTTETVPPSGGSATTDPTATGPTSSDPITTTVIVPATAGGGTVTIAETAVTETPPAGGYQFLGQQVDISSSAATDASNPLTIVFTIDASALLAATGMASPPPDSVDITRAEGSGSPAVIATCMSTGLPIVPDRCVSDRHYVAGGDLQVTVLTASASHWNTAVKPVGVTVANTGYSPTRVTVAQGGIVLWTFGASKPHSATDNLKLGPAKAPLFDSGPLTSGRSGSVFRAAGTYTYGSTVKGDPGSFAGSVGVPLRIVPSSGGTTTPFTVTWSSSTISGYVFDVQYRFMKAGSKTWSSFKLWQTGATAANGVFTPPSGAGTYAFSARLRNATTAMVSLWSPETMVVIAK